MLVLKRKVNERIVLPDSEIAIQVVYIGRDCVCIAIEAPKDQRIYREEVWNRIQGEQS